MFQITRIFRYRPIYCHIIQNNKFCSTAKRFSYKTIPGGGLGKLQGVQEEEYFCKEQKKLLKRMKVIGDINTMPADDKTITEIEELEHLKNGTFNCTHDSCNHLKNAREELYFLNEQTDSLQILEKNPNFVKKFDKNSDSE